MVRPGVHTPRSGCSTRPTVFALITREIRARGGDVADGIVHAARRIARRLPVYSLNMIVTTADGLWALRYPETHDLYVLERRHGGQHLDHSGTAGRLRVMGDADVILGGAVALLPEQTHLVAEIVSPHNHRRDYHDKPRIYAEAGIPTFLRIELTGAAPPHIEVLRLNGGAYTLVAKASAGQTLDLAEPFPVTFDPGHLLGRRTG